MTISSLVVRGLKKSYGARQVVRDVSLEVASGEVVGLLGPNGAGKTTSFYMIVGLVPSDGGEIDLDNAAISRLPIHERAALGLSYLPQEASVFRKLTVEDNIRAVLELRKENGKPLSRDEIEGRLNSLLHELQIEKLRESQALSLSGGERRRVEIARALATDPRFVLLDEPFAGIDPIAVIEIQRIVRFLKERGIGVLITDHNVRETLGICDRAYIINQGTVLASGSPDDIIANECAPRVSRRTLPHVSTNESNETIPPVTHVAASGIDAAIAAVDPAAAIVHAGTASGTGTNSVRQSAAGTARRRARQFSAIARRRCHQLHAVGASRGCRHRGQQQHE